MKVQPPPVNSTDSTGYKRRASYHPVRMKVPIPPSAFLTPPQWEVGASCWLLKGEILGSPLDQLCAWRLDLSLFCGVWFEHSSYCGKVFLQGCSFPGPLSGGGRPFFGTFFVLCTVVFTSASFSSVQSEIHEAERIPTVSFLGSQGP